MMNSGLRRLLSGAVALMLLGCSSALADTATVTARKLILREKASSTSDALQTLPKGTKLEVLGKSGSWYKVTYGKYTGYVYKTYVSVTKTASSSSSSSSATRLEKGSTGSAVKDLQTKLKKLGYYDAYVDGDYGDTTVAAVKAFQKKYNLTADGIAGKETLKKLDSVYENANSAKDDDSLRMGDSGSAVKDLQTKLKKLGYYDGTVDSTFGSGTYAAVKAFQKKYNLTADGVAGSETLKKLDTAYKNAGSDKDDDSLRKGATGSAVKNLQTKLKKLGFYNAYVDGSYGWNASRFIMMNLEGKTVTEPENLNDLCAEDKWILSHLNTVIREATENMEKYELGIAVQKVYDFLWDELCDWYIEMAKVRLWKAEEDPKAANDALWTLRTALTEGLKLLHPYMPFITEEIYCTLLPEEESIMISEWPVYREERNFPDAEKAIEGFKEVVRGIRNTRTEMNVPNNRKTSLHILAKDADTAAMYENSKKSFVNLAFAKEILVQTDKNGISEDAVSVVVSNAVVYMPLEDLIDKDKEIERLTKETERLAKEIARCEGMLNNPNFVNKAPAAKVDAEKDKLAKYKEMMDKVKGQLEQLQK